EALNRLVGPREPISDEDLALLTNRELGTLKRAHCDDIEAGRPDDGIFHRALFCKMRANKQQAGASLDAATTEAEVEATHIIEELTKNMASEGRCDERETQTAASAPKTTVRCDPEGILQIYAFVNRKWQEGGFQLYYPTREGR